MWPRAAGKGEIGLLGLWQVDRSRWHSWEVSDGNDEGWCTPNTSEGACLLGAMRTWSPPAGDAGCKPSWGRCSKEVACPRHPGTPAPPPSLAASCGTRQTATVFRRLCFRHWGRPRTQCSLVQLLSRVRLFATPWTAAHQVSMSITNSWSLPKLMSIELVMPSNHLTLCHPFLLPPSVFPSIRVFSNESALNIRWPKYWSFSINISPSSEYSGVISFRIDWLDLLAVQATLKSLLQHYSSKASIILCSVFFIVQLSHPYMTTGKTIALTRGPLLAK